MVRFTERGMAFTLIRYKALVLAQKALKFLIKLFP